VGAASGVANPIVIPSTDFTLVGVGPAAILTDEEVRAVRAQVMASFARAKSVHVDVLVDNGHPVEQILERARSLPADSDRDRHTWRQRLPNAWRSSNTG
jgi:hypothetical protein